MAMGPGEPRVGQGLAPLQHLAGAQARRGLAACPYSSGKEKPAGSRYEKAQEGGAGGKGNEQQQGGDRAVLKDSPFLQCICCCVC